MLSIMNEIDPCLLLPLCVLYEIQNQPDKSKRHWKSFLPFLCRFAIISYIVERTPSGRNFAETYN